MNAWKGRNRYIAQRSRKNIVVLTVDRDAKHPGLIRKINKFINSSV